MKHLRGTNGHVPNTNLDAHYTGMRTNAGIKVTVRSNDGIRELHPRTDLVRFLQIGFDWAKSGSGSAQLALALLADITANDDFALKHYQVFHHEIIARLQRIRWELTGQQALQQLRFVCKDAIVVPNCERSKIATIRAFLEEQANGIELTAQGQGRGVRTAATRALLNLLGNKYLRRRRITSLQIELSIANSCDDSLENA